VSGATVAGPSPDQPTDADWVAARAIEVLDEHWRPPGFCVPNAHTYPWQWLWDSCFHAVCWAHLGRPDRARTELVNALRHQAPDGFVPHINYWSSSGRADDDTHASFWGRPSSSSITQPPMYGHAVAELVRRGVDLDDSLVDQARAGLRFWLDGRGRTGAGSVAVHPWESGCDDSPRWDGWADVADPATRAARWRVVKGDLVEALRFAPGGSPVGSSAFEVVGAGSSALLAFNAAELADVTGDAALAGSARRVAAALDRRWSHELATWTDLVVVGPTTGAAVRTADALLGVLVSTDPVAVDAAFAQLADPVAFAAPYGPTGVDRREPSFDPCTYWRGPAWPQLAYLLWLAARRRGRDADAGALAGRLVSGARRSGLAEYWEPDTGEGLGAIPQSWSALASLVG
jgi:hypothetical protein